MPFYDGRNYWGCGVLIASGEAMLFDPILSRYDIVEEEHLDGNYVRSKRPKQEKIAVDVDALPPYTAKSIVSPDQPAWVRSALKTTTDRA
jgi:hypothetical protein